MEPGFKCIFLFLSPFLTIKRRRLKINKKRLPKMNTTRLFVLSLVSRPLNIRTTCCTSVFASIHQPVPTREAMTTCSLHLQNGVRIWIGICICPQIHLGFAFRQIDVCLTLTGNHTNKLIQKFLGLANTIAKILMLSVEINTHS